jgi:hypothetical protein
MNNKLDEVFNIEPTVKEVNEVTETPITEIAIQHVDVLDKIDAALPKVEGMGDDEMDELAKAALEGYNSLFELGMNVDPKDAGEILSVAANLLSHAVTARQNKILKKLKIVELQVKKYRVDSNLKKINEDVNIIDGHATLIDRNSLIAQLSAKKTT